MKNLTITLLFAALGLLAFVPTAKKPVSPLGTDKTKDWSGDPFIEKKVRVKK